MWLRGELQRLTVPPRRLAGISSLIAATKAKLASLPGVNYPSKIEGLRVVGTSPCPLFKSKSIKELCMSVEQTLSIIKPDGVQKDLIGEIYDRFEKAGLQIVAARMVQLSKERAEDLIIESVGLRVGIKKTGCSGYAYVVNYADDIADSDVVFEDHGVKVVVDKESLELIDGTEVDFVKQGLNEAFRFRNPNVTGECGCGESFSV